MPWKETQVFDERIRFVHEYQTGLWTMAGLCREFGISRKTGNKYWKRYQERGLAGLRDYSRAPHRSRHAVSEEKKKEILRLKRRHPTWGAPKLRDWLVNNRSDQQWPVPSTIHELLDRNGLVRRRKQRRRAVPSASPIAPPAGPNDLWCFDFKGHFKTGRGKRCDPLTGTDAFSRYSLCCKGLESTAYAQGVEAAMLKTFSEYGLPNRLLSDNGSPFSSIAIGGLSQFSVLLIRLNIRIERIVPGEPQQNGKHERFHLTLKQDTASPPAETLRSQQRRFDRFQKLYNEERPHESLNGKPPASIYVASSRQLPSSLPEIEPPPWAEVRKVQPNGMVSFGAKRFFVSEVLTGEYVGLLQQSERFWSLRFGPLELGLYDEATNTLKGHRQLVYVDCE